MQSPSTHTTSLIEIRLWKKVEDKDGFLNHGIKALTMRVVINLATLKLISVH